MCRERGLKRVVLLSGGLDSAVACAWSLKQGAETVALNLRGEERLDVQTRCAQRLAEHFGIRIEVITAPFPSSAFRSLDAGLRSAPGDAWNSLTLSADLFEWIVLAAALARRLELSEVLVGLNQENTRTAPAISARLLADIERLLGNVADREVGVAAPFLTWSKDDVVRLGVELGVPFEMTWSCERHGSLHCGSCPHCVTRQKAFSPALGIADPTSYEHPLS